MIARICAPDVGCLKGGRLEAKSGQSGWGTHVFAC